MKKEWMVYIIKCNDGSYYTGITNSLAKRVEAHRKGKASRYTRSRLPIELIAVKMVFTKSEALKLEIKIKKKKKNDKIRFLMEYNCIVN